MLLDPCDRVPGLPCPACSDLALATSGLEALFHSVRELVEALCARREVFAVIERGETAGYVQVLADCDGMLVLEVGSNESLARPVLSGRDEVELLRLGFGPPCDASPNWHRFFADAWPPPAPVVAELAVRILVGMFDAPIGELVLAVDHAVDGLSLLPAIERCVGPRSR